MPPCLLPVPPVNLQRNGERSIEQLLLDAAASGRGGRTTLACAFSKMRGAAPITQSAGVPERSR